MHVQIHSSWEKQLKNVFEDLKFIKLTEFVRKEYRTHKCYPPGNLIFEAFNRCPFDKVKVVILGQDPYHGKNQAHGLAFSVEEGVKHPPSLINIFREIEDDISISYPNNGNLNRWADQGVFLLNSTLSVRSNKAGSHQKRVGKSLLILLLRLFHLGKMKLFLCCGEVMQKRKLY